MTKNSEHVIKWRRRTKERIIQSFDKKCGICDYNRCQGALELHHLDPSEKEFSIGKIRACPKSWKKIVEELRKCVLLCANCHREYHNNLIDIPTYIKRFNETFSDYLEIQKQDRLLKAVEPCPVCGNEKPIHNKTCSLSCAAKLAEKYDWSKIDLQQLYFINKKSKCEIASIVGCSEAAVRKRLKKLNMI